MILVKLREAMNGYRQRTGERLTYELLAQRTGLSRPTLESLSSRATYNPRLSTIDKLCQVLRCTPGELLEFVPDHAPNEGERE